MSVFSGQVNGEPIGRPLTDRLHLSDAMLVADDNTYNPLIYSVPTGKTGSYYRVFPSPVYNNFSALKNQSVNSPFYQGVYFQQAAVIINGGVVPLGFITSDTFYSFELFITHAISLTVEAIGVYQASANVTVENLSVGDPWYPYEEKTISLLATEGGAGIINTDFYIKFVEDPRTYTIGLSGARAGRSFLFEPDWSDGIVVERRFLTSVFESHDMSETRKILRHRPLRSIEASLMFSNKYGAGLMWSRLRDAAKAETAHPWYPDRSPLTAQPLASRVYCDVTYRRFQEGGYAFLAKNVSSVGQIYYEIVQILTLHADGFTTVSPIEKAYAVNDPCYPAFTCYAALSGNASELYTEYKGMYSFVAEEVYSTDTLDSENSGYTPTVRNGFPMLDVLATFNSNPEIEILMGGESKDSGRGTLVTTKGVPYVTQTVTALCRDKEECWNTVGFFNYLKGRGKPFWAKSELNFLSITGTSGNIKFSIDNLNSVADMDYLTYVHITDANGDYDVLEVVNRVVSGGGIEIEVEANSLAGIVTVRQAHAVRLAEDVITEEYLTDSVMLTTFTVQELQGAY